MTPKKLNGGEEYLLCFGPLESLLVLQFPTLTPPPEVVNPRLRFIRTFTWENLPNPGTKLLAALKLSTSISDHSRCCFSRVEYMLFVRIDFGGGALTTADLKCSYGMGTIVMG